MASKIEIIVSSINEKVRKLFIKPTSPVMILNQLYPKLEHDFIFDGFRLNKDKTFDEQGIQNGSIIIGIPSSQYNEKSSIWLPISRDTDFLQEKIVNLLNPDLKDDRARIHDLYFLKFEEKPRLFKRLVAQFYKKQDCILENQVDLKLDLIKPDGPSTEELPVFW